MSARFYPVFEQPLDGVSEDPAYGSALARAVEAHPTLALLLDFCAVDPIQIALEVGMVSPLEEDGAEDLSEIDFGPTEWFEPASGLAAVERSLTALHENPHSLAAAIYDPTLSIAAVSADLEAIGRLLLAARQREIRFHFLLSA